MRPMRWLWLGLGVLLAGTACGDDARRHREARTDGPNTMLRAGCIEETSPLADDASTPAGIAVRDVLRIVRDERSAPLTWPDGATTEVKLAMLETRVFLTKSRSDPNYGPNVGTHCDDRVTVQAHARVSTADGKFEAELPKLLLEVANDASMWGTSGGLPKRALRASYANTAVAANECLHFTAVRVVLSESEFHGELANIVGNAPCESTDGKAGIEERTGAEW